MVVAGLDRLGDAVLGAETTNSSVAFSLPFRVEEEEGAFRLNPEASGRDSTSSSTFLLVLEELALIAGVADFRGEGVMGRVVVVFPLVVLF